MLIASIDIETYGKVETYPPQTVFHPVRSRFTDKVPYSDQNLTCAITLVELPSSVGSLTFDRRTFCGSMLAAMKPGDTMVGYFNRTADRKRLCNWVRDADVGLGQNIWYDILYLRRGGMRYFLDERLFLVDLSVLNYLHNELRPEKSLKAVGNILGSFSYDESIIGDYRFKSIDDPILPDYNGQDTHNVVLAISAFARRILTDHPNSDKLTPYCLSFYNDAIWTCIRMAEAGIPINRKKLLALEQKMQARVERCNRIVSSRGLMLSGKGSQKSKSDFMLSTIKDIDAWSEMWEPERGSILDDPLLQLTEKRKEVCFSFENRTLLKTYLQPRDDAYRLIKLIDRVVTSQKVVSSFTYPLLRHTFDVTKKRKGSIYESLAIPLESDPDYGIAYPSWYPVPSSAKDISGVEGGTIQTRPTCKNPAAQTHPTSVKKCYCSRYTDGTLIFFDLSQIELRVPAVLSGEPSLVRNYRDGRDLHRDRAVYVFGDSCLSNPFFGNGDMTKDPRQWGKQFNFMDLFWAAASKMRRVILELSGRLFPHDFFQAIVDSRPVLRPVLYEWQRHLVDRARKDGILYLPFVGQSRHFEGGTKYDVSEILNFPVQTTAATIMLCIAAEVCKRLGLLSTPHPRALLFHNVYDSGVLDIQHPEDVEWAASIVRESVHEVATNGHWAMIQDHYGHGKDVPLKCEIKIVRGTHPRKERP